jgi:hypothetical protein
LVAIVSRPPRASAIRLMSLARSIAKAYARFRAATFTLTLNHDAARHVACGSRCRSVDVLPAGPEAR